MADVVIRRATSNDVDAIAALGRDVVPATYGPLAPDYAEWCLGRWWSEAQVTASLAELPHWVAVDEDAVVGVANLGEMDGEPVMWKLYVHPARHREGLGRQLLDEVEAAAGSALRLEHLGSNDRAAGFYEAQGYRPTHTAVIDAFPDLTWVWRRQDLRRPDHHSGSGSDVVGVAVSGEGGA